MIDPTNMPDAIGERMQGMGWFLLSEQISFD